MKKIIRIADMFICIVLAFVFAGAGFGNYFLPNSVSVSENDNPNFGGVFYLENDFARKVDSRSDNFVSGKKADIKLLGIIPIKTVSVSNADKGKVAVSGEPFGIKIYTDGVMVVGTKDVAIDGRLYNPAKAAGIEVGDIITAINNNRVTISTDVEKYLSDNNGKKYKIKVKRDGKYKTFYLSPVFSNHDGCYKAGIWVRDSTAGIGTITFYNPTDNVVAALGHPITDVDTGEIMPILHGEAVVADVTKIYKSKSGYTGSLCCDFTTNKIADLSENTEYGIYGVYDKLKTNASLYEVATAEEVEKGDCQILTTVTDGKPKFYNAKITRISYRDTDEQKNMVVKITDNELLSITGGIVQGMSGSPIIQNGKLIGALTHVIVDNPQKGYAIFAESMVKESKNVE